MSCDTQTDVTLEEWNGFGFKYVEKSEYPKILKSLQGSFYLDEPIHKVLGVTPERSADMDQKITDVLNLNHGTFYAFPLDQPEKVAAVLIIWIHKNGEQLPPLKERSPLTTKVKKYITQLHSLYDIHEERKAEIYPELFIISTDREYRGKGLATEMYRKGIAKMRMKGYPFVSSTFSNPISRKFGAKLGFKQVSRLDFDDCKYDDGSLVFGEGGKGHYAIETILELK